MSDRKADGAPEMDNTPSEPAALYRDAFLHATAHLGISREEAASIVQAVSGRRFDECGWSELKPVVQELQILLDELVTSPTYRRDGCHR